MSPIEQIELMDAIDRETNRILKDPSEIDLERYYFYIEKGTDNSMIAPLPKNQFERFCTLISPKLINSNLMTQIKQTLNEEITNEYVYSMKKAIVDYVLMNSDERRRLKIDAVPKKFIFK
jgi:dynein heavy chain